MKKSFSRGAAMAALGLLVAQGAGAATLYTPPADAGYADEILGCRVTNLSKTPRSVIIEARNYSGTVVNSASYVISPEATEGYDGVGSYCKFTVDGIASSVRASAVYLTVEGIVTTTVQAR